MWSLFNKVKIAVDNQVALWAAKNLKLLLQDLFAIMVKYQNGPIWSLPVKTQLFQLIAALLFFCSLSGQSKEQLDHFSWRSAPFCLSLWASVALPCPVTWCAGLCTKWLVSPLLVSSWGWHASAFCSHHIHMTWWRGAPPSKASRNN